MSGLQCLVTNSLIDPHSSLMLNLVTFAYRYPEIAEYPTDQTAIFSSHGCDPEIPSV